MSARNKVTYYEDFLAESDANYLVVKESKSSAAQIIDNHFNNTKLQNNYRGSFKSFLAYVLSLGYTTPYVEPRVKSGDSSILSTSYIAQELSLSQSNNSNNGAAFNEGKGSKPVDQSAGGSTPQNTQTMNTNSQQQDEFSGMAGAAKISKLMADSERYSDFKRWYEKELEKREAAEKKLEEVKEADKEKYEKLKDQFDNFKFEQKMKDKPGAIDRIVTAIENKPELLSGIMQALPQGVKQDQLNAPGMNAAASGLDENTLGIAKSITNRNDKDQNTLIQTINHYEFGTEEFISQLEKLVDQFHEEHNSKLEEEEQSKKSA